MKSTQGPPDTPQNSQQTFTPEKIAQIQKQLVQEAAKNGMTVPQYMAKIKSETMRQQNQGNQPDSKNTQVHQHTNHNRNQKASAGRSVTQERIPINEGPPRPEAVILAQFLKQQNLKPRTCIFEGKRKEIFRVKRALRAIQSPAYEKLRAKHPNLPPVTDNESAENVFKMLPVSLLALRVSKIEPGYESGHSSGVRAGKKQKRVKGLWTVRVETQQTTTDECHYMWLYEGSQWKQKLYAIGALTVVITVVMFPLWPLFLRKLVWYMSMGVLGLVALFFGMAFVRLILFSVTLFTYPPGLWLYPNLFEDVGFFDSFRPVWEWQQTPELRKQQRQALREKKLRRAENRQLKLEKAKATGVSPTE